MIERLVKNTLSLYKDMPVEFCKDILDMQLIWEGQQKIFESVVNNKRTTVPSGHSTGKSASASVLTLWWLSTRYKSRVLVTSPTFRQLMTVYYAEVNKWYQRSVLRDLNMFNMLSRNMTINDDNLKKEWYMLPVSPKNSDSLQGQHGDKSEDVRSIMNEMGIEEINDNSTIKEVVEKLKLKSDDNESNDNLLVIIDEGSGVSQEIMETLEGTDYSRLVIFGNMTKNTGMFYDSVYRSKGEFNVIKLSSYDSPFMSYEQIKYMERRYGKDSNVVKVRLKGDAPDGENDTIISRQLLESNINIKIDEDNIIDEDIINIGCDVARFGDDNTQIYIRKGNYIIDEITLSKKSTMRGCGEISRVAKEYEELDIYAKIDTVGVGGGVADRLVELDINNLNIVETINNEKANDEEEYSDKITEMFYDFKEKLEKGLVSMLDDEELIEDLAGRKYEFDSRGRLRIESKKKFKERFGRSPDKGDSFLACWYEQDNTSDSILYI